MDFNLFKPKARGWECLGPSVLAKAATFENSCDLSMWMATRYKANKTDDSFSKWQLEHTSVLNKLNLHLQAEYPNEKIHMECPTQKIPLHGNVLYGTPDAVVEFSNGDLLIADAKSGKKSQSHWIQCGIYGVMLQAAAWSKKKPIPKIIGFALCYGDENSSKSDKENKQFLRITGDNATDEVLPESTKKRIRNILRVSSATDMPEAKPSANNCRYCDWKLGCPKAIETSHEVTADASHLL